MANSFQASLSLILEKSKSDDSGINLADILNLVEFSVADLISREPQDIFRDISSLSRELKWSSVRVCKASDVQLLDDDQPLGSGTSFTVFKGLLEPEKQFVAVKRLNVERLLGTSALDAQNERNRSMLSSAALELRTLLHPWFRSHPNIVDLLAVFWESSSAASPEGESSVYPVLVVELADETIPTLYLAIVEHSSIFSEVDIFLFLEDVAEGLTISHSSKLIHGDIKPENILMFWNGTRYVCKVSDFGFSRPSVDDNITIGGTLYWNAPECMTQAPEAYRPYALTLTRDLYSFGLLMWFVLFLEFPFGAYGVMSEDEIASQKLFDGDKGITARLKERLQIKALKPNRSSTTDDVLTKATKDGLLWWQIQNCMIELFKTKPNQRNIALGEIHYVLRTPENDNDVFVPDALRRGDIYKRRRYKRWFAALCDSPLRKAGQSLDEEHRKLDKSNASQQLARLLMLLQNDAYYAEELPLEVQKSRFQQTKSKLDLSAPGDPDRSELLQTLASFYNLGIGTEHNPKLAFELELEAAKTGSVLAQLFVMNLHFTNNLPNGVDLKICATTMRSWILNALVVYQDKTVKEEAEIARKVEKLLLDIPEDHLDKCLDHTYTHTWVREFRIVDKEWHSESAQKVVDSICTGDSARLQRNLRENPSSIKLRVDGYNLLHIAVEQCQVEIMQYLLTSQHFSPNEPNDEGNSPFELAALKGSLECCLMLLGAGASPNAALSQGLFTSVAMTGGRARLKADNATSLRRTWELLQTIATDAKFALTERLAEGTIQTTSTPITIERDLVNGVFRYVGLPLQVETWNGSDSKDKEEDSEEEDVQGNDEHFSPLQYALSLAHHNSVLALLALGADTNYYLNEHPPLHLAVLTQQPYLVAQLLARGADANIRDIEKHELGTPLHVANNFQMVTFFVPNYLHIVDFSKGKRGEAIEVGEEGGEVNRKDDEAEIEEYQLQEFGGNLSMPELVVSIIHLLVNAGADVHAVDSKGYTPLALAEKYEDEVAAETLRALGAER